MKAWIIEKFDGVEHAKIGEVADPEAAAGEVVLRMKFAALNPADAYLAKGEYPAKPPLPHVLGRDGIGEVVAVGADVRDIKVGDKKVILRGDVGVKRWGTFAQLASVPIESLVDVPNGWSDEESAGAALVYVTSYQALTDWDDLPKHANVLISGASGGVGVASTQLAIAMGHTVIGLSRNAQKREKLKSIGMSLALDPSSPQWKSSLKNFLGDKKVNLVIDNIGGGLFPDLISVLGENGRMSIVGRLAGPVPEFNTSSLLFRRLKIGGIAVGANTNAESRAAWKKVVELLAKIDAKPLIDEIFPFEQLPAAFSHLARGPMGKVLLRI